MCPQTAIIAVREPTTPITTDEIERLTAAAGYTVAATVTQARAVDPKTNLGPGAVDRVAEHVASTEAETVVVDNDLTAQECHRIETACPAGTRVLDRVRLVLELFGERADSRAAALQAERASLKQELPRLRAAISQDVGSESLRAHDEEGKPIAERERRIDELDSELAALREAADERRAQRRAEGFDLVALAGYTNAGKSTLLRRLADDLSVTATGHTDIETAASVADRLCETLETTTRRATLDGRRVLLTDTVGFVGDVPAGVTASFHSTLGAIENADLVAVVLDASEPPETIRDHIGTVRETLPEDARVLPVCNKVDRLDADEQARRLACCSTFDRDPVAVSATTGANVDTLVDRLTGALPALASETLTLPNSDTGMSLLSWLYDHGQVRAVEYEGATVTVEFAAGEALVAQARSRAESCTPTPTGEQKG